MHLVHRAALVAVALALVAARSSAEAVGYQKTADGLAAEVGGGRAV